MFLAVLLKNYKVFHKNFLVQLSKPGQSFSSVIGRNGVGKSTVLEAIDTVLNSREWVPNNRYSKTSGYVSLCAEINIGLLGDGSVEVAKSVDEFLRFFDDYFKEQKSTNNDALVKFSPFLKSIRSNNLLAIFGKRFGCERGIGPYYAGDVIHDLLISKIELDLEIDEDSAKEKYDKYCAECIGLFGYSYISVEEGVPELLRLEKNLMKKILPRDIVSRIIEILDQKRITVRNNRRGRNPTKSTVQLINDDLNLLSREINHTVRNVDDGYSFKSLSNTKNLTSRDLTDAIIEAFFSTKSFVKDGIPVKSLSSGEKRMALVDIVFSFLSKSGKSKISVMAIDEPENSLHISSGFEQFRKLIEMSEVHGCQVICTSHWYGFIPIVSSGGVAYIGDGRSDFFSTDEFIPGNGKVPAEVLLKSGYELASSIVHSIRFENVCWIVCEGLTDRLYLSSILEGVEGYKVVAASNDISVINIFKQLSMSLKGVGRHSFPGKVVCLIDTDPDTPDKISDAEGFNEIDGVLYFRRLNYLGGSFRLSSLPEKRFEKCSIEDSLYPVTGAKVLSSMTGLNYVFKPERDFLMINSHDPSFFLEDDFLGELEGFKIAKNTVFGDSPDQREVARFKNNFCRNYLALSSEEEIAAHREAWLSILP
ncbi:AAA family ATPase [Halomonas sp. 328]|uniref:AAA family ATPase n=1 Tax=Halomonas sp. 328 TaxID=2776704 RepID=UPI0018A79C98|nr:AAA family ATPase [Halomonas sp. 328]MBF8222290.1 AAA family ATPase [Halomonas sp. 328]